MTSDDDLRGAGKWTRSPSDKFERTGVTPALAWAALRTARRADADRHGASARVYALPDGGVAAGAAVPPGARTILHAAGGAGWRDATADGDAAHAAHDGGPDAGARELLALYLPLLAPVPDAGFVLAHLGQSLDGCIATRSGHAQHVTGAENLTHLHRLRALCDAVLVGAGTVAADDPRLTVRRVPGSSPVRVVLDPRGELASPRRLFDDGAAPTLVVVPEGGPEGGPRRLPDIGRAERVPVARDARGGPDLAAALEALAARGLRRVFVEGGGVTVTRFVEAGLVDRLHVAVAPVFIGRGTPGLRLGPAATMSDALRPPCALYRHGNEVLWDFDLRAERASRA